MVETFDQKIMNLVVRRGPTAAVDELRSIAKIIHHDGSIDIDTESPEWFRWTRKWRKAEISRKSKWDSSKPSFELAMVATAIENDAELPSAPGLIARSINFTRAMLSRGLSDRRVDEHIFASRVKSCSGCKNLAYSDGGKYHYCNACGCGQQLLAALDVPGKSNPGRPVVEYDGPYTKLHYPYLKCPLDRSGFHVPKIADRLDMLHGAESGRILVLVANGPSRDEVELERLAALDNADFMSINTPDMRVWPTKYWCFVDQSQAKDLARLISVYPGTIFNTASVKSRRADAILVKSATKMFSTNLHRGAHVGRTTTFFAMQIAYWLGYDHVYLFGVDMASDKSGKLYSWGSNPHVKDAERIKRFQTENETFEWAGQNLPEPIRSRFTFCSSYNIWPFQRHFEHVQHETAIDLIVGRHHDSSPQPRPVAKKGRSPLTLITPTGGRPEAFALCERYMRRQTYRGDIQWIVVDDCETPTETTMGQDVIRPTPFWRCGDNTQARNMLAALDRVGHDRILIIEDDDWYHPDYLRVYAEMLDRFELVGEGRARYYNVALRCWRQWANTSHASACQTGFRSSLIPVVRKTVQAYRLFDVHLWTTPGLFKHIFHGMNLAVGIKGMPGRHGIGVGHIASGFTSDPEFAVLSRWIGSTEASVYGIYYAANRLVEMNAETYRA